MFEFRFPDIGEGIHEGVLLRWFVNAGDSVKEGDSLCEMETDKVNAELPSPAAGVVKEVRGKVGDTINVGDVLVVIQTAEDKSEAVSGDKGTKPVDEGNAGVVGELEVSDELMSTSDEGLQQGDNRRQVLKVLATPVARKMAYDLGIDLEEVMGTGPSGRVMKADIQRSFEAKQSKDIKPNVPKEAIKTTSEAAVAIPDEKGLEESIKLSSLRKTIARKMTESMYTIPHAVCYQDIDITNLVDYRESVKNIFKEEKGFSITYLPFIIKAIVLALKDYPRFNSQLSADGEALIVKKYYDVGIAVDTTDGLMVPVIRSADKRSILELMEESVRLSNGARGKSLKLEELKGSTFTITNFGAVGASFGAPIINYPEVAILGIGKIEQKAVVINNEIVIRWILPISLAFDHRVVDGGDAGRLLKAFEKYIKEPDALLLR